MDNIYFGAGSCDGAGDSGGGAAFNQDIIDNWYLRHASGHGDGSGFGDLAKACARLNNGHGDGSGFGGGFGDGHGDGDGQGNGNGHGDG